MFWQVKTFCLVYTWQANKCRSQWPRGLRRWSAAARLLGLRVRIPPSTWMSVSPLPEESYRWLRVCVCVCVCPWVWSSAAVTFYTSSEQVEIGQNKKESRRVFVSQERYCVCVLYRAVHFKYPGQVYELWEHDHTDQSNTWQVYPSTKFCPVNQWLERYDSYWLEYLYNHLSHTRVVGRWQGASTMPIAMKPYIRRLDAYRDTGAPAKGRGGCSRAARPQNRKKNKKRSFADTMIWNVLCDLVFSRNQLLKWPMTSTLEFWKSKIKTHGVLEEHRLCDFS
jgi:hypothetical protein